MFKQSTIGTLILFTTLLVGCGTRPFVPTEYPLREGLVPSLGVSAPVVISNGQPSTELAIVYSSSGSKLGSDLKSITEVMVQQTNKEIQKSNQLNSTKSPSKSITLKVNSLQSNYIAFFFKSNMAFQATLGNGSVIDFTAHHGSGSVAQDINGCIAEGVITLLNDKRVRAYLASGT